MGCIQDSTQKLKRSIILKLEALPLCNIKEPLKNRVPYRTAGNIRPFSEHLSTLFNHHSNKILSSLPRQPKLGAATELGGIYHDGHQCNGLGSCASVYSQHAKCLPGSVVCHGFIRLSLVCLPPMSLDPADKTPALEKTFRSPPFTIRSHP